MRFAIRDDDTNFFTDPDELRDCYGAVWDLVPPSLCIITKVKGNWPKWTEHIYEHKQDTDWESWQADNTIYPIEENEALIDFLKTMIRAGKIDVCFHAKHHRNSDEILPPEVESNYIRCAEYFTVDDHADEIKQEIEHLSRLLDYKVSVFAPPQDLLSFAGYTSVLQAGLNICGGGISFLKKQKDLKGTLNMLKQFAFKTIFPNDPYPFVLDFRTHKEIPYYYPLLPTTHLETLINQFEMVRKHDGDFVLSTHHAEFDYRMEYDHRLKMKDVLKQFLAYIARFELEYISLSKMLSTPLPKYSKRTW